MKLMRPRLSEVLSRFVAPLRKRPLTIWGATITIVAFLCVWTGVQELISQNSSDIAFMAAELLQESGPDFARASKDHATMLRRYVEHMERRHLSSVLRLFYPGHSPKKQLEEALAILLEKTPDNDQLASSEAIWKAGEHLTQFYLDSKASAGGKVRQSRYERLPATTLRDLNIALAQAHKLVNILEEEPTLKNAQHTCMANRKATFLLFLARFGYEDHEQIKQFEHDVGRARTFTIDLSNKVQGPEAELLRSYAESESLRISIIRAMLDSDHDKVNALLKETIQKAVEYVQKDNCP